MIRRRILISGQVQGVSFRYSTVREAQRFPGLQGFVRNLADGRVEAVFQGGEAAVEAMLKWCAHGPRTAKVTGTEVFEEKPASELGPFSQK